MKNLSEVSKNVYIKYVPHGINTETYKPTEVDTEFKKSILGDNEYDFVLFWSNRNIRRKQAPDVIMAFKGFCDKIGVERAKKVALVLHTQPIDENGTDLPAVVRALAPDCNIIFSDKRHEVAGLNQLYNIADCTINIAGNEGFGLTTAESVMAGTPIIVNVTGGLQDQCGFKLDGKYLTADDYIEIQSLHDWRKWEGKLEWGEWARPVWSRAQTLAGSVPTPYIWDDKVDVFEVSEAIEEMYNLGRTELKRRGLVGREAFINDMGLSHTNMCGQLIDGIDYVLENWKPRHRYEVVQLR